MLELQGAPPPSHDIFAETNPAFCALVLAATISAYRQVASVSMPVTLIPLILPIVMSGELDRAFKHTSHATGLSGWISRTPTVIFGLQDRVQAGIGTSLKALQFGIHYRVLEINDHAQVGSLTGTEDTDMLRRLGFERTASKAKRLGSWFAALRSDGLVYNLLGLEV